MRLSKCMATVEQSSSTSEKPAASALHGIPAILLLASLTGLAHGEGNELPMPTSSNTVTLNGIRCRYPDAVIRLPESRLAIRYECRNTTAHIIQTFAPPRLELLDETGVVYPPDLTATGDLTARFHLDQRKTDPLPPEGVFNGLDVFAVPAGLMEMSPAWRAQISTPNQHITFPLFAPPIEWEER